MAKHPARQGIETRRAKDGRESFRGVVYDRATGRNRKGPWLPSLAAARAWRTDALRVRRSPAGLGRSLDDAVAAWLDAAAEGRVVNRSGDRYKPSTLASYRADLTLRILPEIGRLRLDEIDGPTLQRLVARLLADGLAPATIRNAVNPLRAIYRDAVAVGEVGDDPTSTLRLPAVRGRRSRVAEVAEGEALLDALAPGDRPLWATALYAGLRRGELAALRGADVDLEAGVLRVHPERGGFDYRSGTFGPPKTSAAVRTVPIPGRLRPLLPEAPELALVFGRDAATPFSPRSIAKRAERAWRAAGLPPISLHECRHTYASYLIASGLNAKAVTVLLGHSSISTTFDLYGHLFPGAESEARALLDGYLG